MTFDARQRLATLEDAAPAYLAVAIENIRREYPYMPWMVVTGPGPLPSHRELHPAFFGSFDWHSCVEMYWVAVRLVRLFPGLENGAAARFAIDALLTRENIATERAFFDNPAHRSFERPYGWGWLLTLQAEFDAWDDPDGHRWAGILRPLSLDIAERYVSWLPMLTYPQRTGMHANTAFGILRALDFAESQAEAGDVTLLDALVAAARRFFEDDADYPAHYEPSGADFLSPALAETELMIRIVPEKSFSTWLDRFLPHLASGNPAALFQPAIVSDQTDGQIAHLAGLNLSRSASFLAIARALPDGDNRRDRLTDAAEHHAETSLGSVTGGDYMVEHWLAAYATLLLTA
jgi:hypothetical protein